MQVEKLSQLEEIGFNRVNSKTYTYKDIKATIYHDYIFFKYSGKEIPVIDEVENMKHLIKGLYNEDK